MLEPGFIPEGWARGDPLRFVNWDFQYGPEMAIMRDVYAPLGVAVDLGFIAGIRVHISEQVAMKAWLKWWNDHA